MQESDAEEADVEGGSILQEKIGRTLVEICSVLET